MDSRSSSCVAVPSASGIWGGRFAERPDDTLNAINASIAIDQRLYREDIAGSRAHAAMLAACGIISAADARAIDDGLQTILQDIESGRFVFRADLEDIHMNIETRLKELIGEPAGRLHTARSRNDQVATDFRLWVRGACDALGDHIETLRTTLAGLAAQHTNTIMPGFTHLQVAQPVTLALHLHAYADMLARDQARIRDCRARLNECPLGAAALAGTPYPIDRSMTARALGFDRPIANTMDAVGARDFVNEFLFAAAQTGLHLSRLAEEVILWTTPQFGFMRLADRWSTGSSIMPQKKNPDAAELVRGKSGQLTGLLVRMMMIMKALPMTYNKDMQDDKETAFAAYDTLALCLRATEGMLATATWHTENMAKAADMGYATATRLADWLVMNLNIPFREAHHITGAVVRFAEENHKRLRDLSLKELQQFHERITDDVFRVL